MEIFVTQPPVTRIVFKTVSENWNPSLTSFEICDCPDVLAVQNPSGVTIQDLATMKRNYKSPDCSLKALLRFEDFPKYAGVLDLPHAEEEAEAMGEATRKGPSGGILLVRDQAG